MRGTPPLRLISTDFDGTIHEDFSDPPIPSALDHRLLDLQAAGVTWVINTGREMASLMECLGRSRIRARPDYLVLVEREIYRNDGGHYVPVEPWNSRCTRDHAELFGELAGDIADLLRGLAARFDATFYEDPWSPLCAIARSNPQMDEIHAEVEAFCAGRSDLQPVRNDIYVRLCHAAYSKGTALGELQRLLDIRPEQTLVAGDHLNDLPMFDRRYAHHLVTPANALPSVRDHVTALGGWLMPERAGHAVVAALERLAG